MTGIRDYGLLAGSFCPECGRATMNRLLYDGLETGCATCDRVTTRHRCISRPDIGGLSDTQSWTCAECGTTWWPVTAAEACADCCGECGHEVIARRWRCAEGGRMATAPRYVSPAGPWRPMRNLIASTSRPGPWPATSPLTASASTSSRAAGARGEGEHP